MKSQRQGQTNADDELEAAFTELKTQRDAAIAEIARLREAHHTRESQLIREKTQLQNENDVLKAQLSDAKRQLRQQESKNTRGSSAVVDLCSSEPEDAEARMVSDDPETRRTSLKRKHSNARLAPSAGPSSSSLGKQWRLEQKTAGKKIKVQAENTTEVDNLRDPQAVSSEDMEAAISQENDVNHPDSDEPGIGEEMNTESSESPDEELTNNTMQIIYRNTAAGSNYRSPMNQAKTLMIAFDSAARHLGSCPPFKVQSTFQGVSRAFLTRVFGCDPKALFAPMCKGSWAGRPVILPNWDFHPFLPGAPGLPGLILSLRNEFFEHPLCSLFIRVTKKPVTWAYYGQYKFVVSGVFSTTDFINQKSTVKEAQADAIMTCPPFHDIRARIYLRKSGMPVTASAVELETQRIKDNDGGKVTHNDVINALSSGEESISIVTMTCIDFDHRFADRIEREWNSR